MLGFILALVYVIILYRKGIFKRIPRYYNWAVKLYIPLLFLGILYVFGQFGVIRGVYKILDSERQIIVAGIYKETVEHFFESEQQKDAFIKNIQQRAVESKQGSEYLVAIVHDYTKEYTTGYTFIDDAKNKVSKYLINKYGNDIYKLLLYSMLNASGKGAHVDISESIPYKDFSIAMDFLLEVGYQDIETVILQKLDEWCADLLSSQYSGMLKSTLILLILIMAIPVLDYVINKKWIEPKYRKGLKNDMTLNPNHISKSPFKSN